MYLNQVQQAHLAQTTKLLHISFSHLSDQTVFETIMKSSTLSGLVYGIGAAARALHIDDTSCRVTYLGLENDGLQHFYGIPYGQDTGGEYRFKPPRLYVPSPGSVIDATKPGVACPQALGKSSPPLGQGNITEVSEDCLNLNIVRPSFKDTDGFEKLPVMVWIHGGKGGSFRRRCSG